MNHNKRRKLLKHIITFIALSSIVSITGCNQSKSLITAGMVHSNAICVEYGNYSGSEEPLDESVHEYRYKYVIIYRDGIIETHEVYSDEDEITRAKSKEGMVDKIDKFLATTAFQNLQAEAAGCDADGEYISFYYGQEQQIRKDADSLNKKFSKYLSKIEKIVSEYYDKTTEIVEHVRQE